MKKILVVEDEQGIQLFIKECLEESGYLVETADDGVEAIAKFKQEHFDLILLDILMPKMDGYSVCEIIRLESDTPIIMLTAMSDEEDQIKGFDVKADDYIIKPFSYPILLKRVEALLRRGASMNQKNPSTLKVGRIQLDTEAYEVFYAGKAILLTGIEFKLLRLLMEHPNQVLTREQLIELAWGFDYYESSEKIVNHHIMNIRKKLSEDCIETVRGVGYKIVEEN